MRCARCEFENIPGQARCIRCGSILDAGSATVEVHPPRMPAWRKPLRATVRWLRGHRMAPERLPGRSVRRALDKILSTSRPFGKTFSGSVVRLLLNVVPGLPHYVKGRFQEVRLYVALWLLCLVLGLFLYGSMFGSLLIGLAIGLHAWIAVQYDVFREITDLASRVGTVLIVVACLTAVYWMAPRAVAPWFTGGHTTLAIPAMNVQTGDYLLVRRFSREDRRLPRGTLVLIHPPGFTNTRLDIWRNPHGTVIGQIAGLPGEMIRVNRDAYAVGQHRLDPARFPVPHWLGRHALPFETSIPPDSYFVSTEYTGNMRPEAAIVRQACVIPASEMQGQAFMRWWPLTRRGFIE